MDKLRKKIKPFLSLIAVAVAVVLYLLTGSSGSEGYDLGFAEGTGFEETSAALETLPSSEAFSTEEAQPEETETSIAETVPPETSASVEEETEPETAETSAAEPETTEAPTEEHETGISEDGTYTKKDDVALYIHTYGHLPSNYIDKKEAEKKGWKSVSGSLWDVCPGKSLCAYFGNYEGQLPKKKGRKWTECDIDYKGKSRGAKRIIFSNDGLIYYTDDHYEIFTQLY